MAGEGHAHRQKLSPEGPPSACARAVRARLSFAKSRASAAYETMTTLANVSPAITADRSQPREGNMPLPFDNMQASLALTQFLPLSGIFPANNSDPTVDPGGVPLGSIRTFAGNFAPGGSAQAEGQLLAINQNQAVFALLGTMYGGNGTTTFALPALDGETMLAAGQLRNCYCHSANVHYAPLRGTADLTRTLSGNAQPFAHYPPSPPTSRRIRPPRPQANSWRSARTKHCLRCSAPCTAATE